MPKRNPYRSKRLGQAIREAEEYTEDNYDEDADCNPLDLLLSECGMDSSEHCSMAGSEQCDFECPFSA